MKKKILLIIFMFIFVPHVNADCDNDRINELKNLAKNVEITYELDTNDDNLEENDYSVNNVGESIPQGNMRIIISGLTEGFLIKDTTYDRTFNYSDVKDGIIVIRNELNGSRTFKVYSTECNKDVRSIFIKIPRYNNYSTDSLCEGISGDDLSVCGMWYEKDIDYETFKQTVEDYKKKVTEQKRIEEKKEKSIIDKTVDFLKNNYLYFIIGIVVIIIIAIIIKVRRKRSVLE